MFYSILFSTLGFFVFQYIFWKKLREDYSSELIFTLSFTTTGTWLLIKTLTFRFLNPWWFWVSLIAAFLVLNLFSRKLKMNRFETFNAGVLAFLSYWGLYLLSDAVSTESIFSFAHSFFVFGIVFLYIFFDTRYKNFSWYKSGRVGFSGLAAFGVYFLLRTVLATQFSFMLSFTVAEIYISGICSFINFLVLYNLARQA